MPQVLLPLIIEFALQYGIPAAINLIDVIKKDTISWDDIQDAFSKAQTPYGLTPEIVTVVKDNNNDNK